MSENREHPGGPEPVPFPHPASAEDTSVADDRERSLDPQSVTVARVAGAIVLAVFAVIGLIGVLVLLFAARLPLWGRLATLGGWLALIAALGVWNLVWPGLRYRYASYRVRERGIQIRRGVLWRSVISVPKSRVQHTDVSQGPLERAFGLATLIIHTAGTEHAAVSLSGLAHPTALRIRDHLIGSREDDAV